MNSNTQTGQLALFSRGQILTPGMNLFGAKDIKDKDGKVVGTSISLMSRKDAANLLDLKGKENKGKLDEAMQKDQDALFRNLKVMVAQMEAGTWTGKSMRHRTGKNGEQSITFAVTTAKRKTALDPEAIAKHLGITVEEVIAMAKRQEAATKVTDVQSEASVQNGAAAPEGTLTEAK